MNKVFALVVLGFLLTYSNLVLAHGDHGVPGALPPAPHGGTVKEAEHNDEDEHHHHEHDEKEEKKGSHAEKAEETELFFEAIYKANEVKIYPLAILPNDPAWFKALNPSKDLTDIKLKIEIPRFKKVNEVSAKVQDDAIVANFDPKGINRFLVHIEASFQKEVKTAKIQIEND